jgi:hypothetical protein
LTASLRVNLKKIKNKKNVGVWVAGTVFGKGVDSDSLGFRFYL